MRFKRFSIHIIFMCALNFFLISPAFSANYYVKNGGNDNANGLSDANAWATIANQIMEVYKSLVEGKEGVIV